ncbi:hypothetical protein GCM10009610_65910 [Pseudonocardia xinjiangensis]
MLGLGRRGCAGCPPGKGTRLRCAPHARLLAACGFAGLGNFAQVITDTTSAENRSLSLRSLD